MYRNNTRIIINMLLGILVIVLALLLFISLVSYNELDPSFNVVNSSDIIFNKMGKFGSYISDFFIQMFGLVSFFIVFIIFKIGTNLIKSKLPRYGVLFKLTMSMLFILSTCALIGKIFNKKIYFGYENMGGTIGYYINSLTIYIQPNILIFLLYAICSFLSLSILFDFTSRKIRVTAIKSWRRTIKLLNILYKITLKILKLIIPKKSIATFNNFLLKIKRVIYKDKIEKENYKNLINVQNKKIEDLERYIKNMKNDNMASLENNLGNIDDDVDDDVEEYDHNNTKKNDGLFSFLGIDKGKKKKIQVEDDKYKLPITNLLESSNNKIVVLTKEELIEQANDLLKVLKDFKINGKITGVEAGPVITLHEFEPSAGTKSSRIIGLADDIARNLKVKSARISVISEKNAIGIELPNRVRNTIFLKDILETSEYRNSNYALPIVLGSDIAGKPVIMDLAKAPHLLIAGTTGSGKSVSINTMILSLLYKFSPDKCKMVMIDPKMLELSVYEGIPHLLTPVVTEPKKAISALRWVVNEMDNRYRMMSSLGVRNIYGYNDKIKQSIDNNEDLNTKLIIGYNEYDEPIYETKEIKAKQLPFIVVIVDEMADLMITAGKDIEILIQRIAQKARAAGIHIIMATQRPSVDIITGVIKANFPSRISFLVSSKIDSKVIIGEQGADQLLGMGDMLYMPNGGKINRAHGPFVSDMEVEKVVNFIIKQGIKPEYIKNLENSDNDENNNSGNFDITINGEKSNSEESLYKQALEIIRRDKKVSISYIQRQLRIGYNKAANLIERMEKDGVITPASINGKRDVIE